MLTGPFNFCSNNSQSIICRHSKYLTYTEGALRLADIAPVFLRCPHCTQTARVERRPRAVGAPLAAQAPPLLSPHLVEQLLKLAGKGYG
jgi:hypothetical protein